MAKRDYFPFMSLPPELRNHIYALVLGTHDLTISYHYQANGLGKALARRPNSRDIDTATNTILNAALIVANHQIYEESHCMLYCQPFHFQDAAALHTFLVAVGPIKRAMLTDVTLHNWNFGYALNSSSINLLADAKHLKRLSIQCDNCVGPGLVAVCAAQSACWDFGKWVEEVKLNSGMEDGGFVTERMENGSGFRYSRSWVRA